MRELRSEEHELLVLPRVYPVSAGTLERLQHVSVRSRRSEPPSRSDPVMAVISRQVYEDLSQGHSLGTVLKGRGLVPEWVSWMAGLGEQRGTLGKTLHVIAEMYRRQVESRGALLRTVLPAFVIIATAGLMTALFAFTVMLPMIKLIEGLAK